MMSETILRTSLKYGVALGLGFCLYTTLMWLTNLDTTYLKIGQYFDIAIIVLPIGIIIGSIRKVSKDQNVTLAQRLIIAILVALISYAIYQPFLYTYHNFINPDWFLSVLQLKENELRAARIPQSIIDETLEKLKKSNLSQSAMFSLTTLIPSVVFIPILSVIVSLFFVRSRRVR